MRKRLGKRLDHDHFRDFRFGLVKAEGIDRTWLTAYARRKRDLFEGDLFPYGIEENRPTWEQMALYTPSRASRTG